MIENILAFWKEWKMLLLLLIFVVFGTVSLCCLLDTFNKILDEYYDNLFKRDKE